MRREDGRVRVSTKLVRVKDQAQVWAESYDQRPKDGWARIVMGWAYEQLGRHAEALASLREEAEYPLRDASFAHVLARWGRREAAADVLKKLLAGRGRAGL